MDLLTIDYPGLANKIATYEEKHGEKPYGLIIDNFTVWDLIGSLNAATDSPEAVEATLLRGPAAFEDTPLRGMEVMVTTKRRCAELVNEERFKREKGDE